MPTIAYKCEALLDQGHYIGDDPIGSACANDADFVYNGVAVCGHCKILIEQEPRRVSFPMSLDPLSIRIDRWKKQVQASLDCYTKGT